MWTRKTASVQMVALSLVLFCVVAIGVGRAPQFGDPLPGLSSDLLARFQVGKEAFEDEEDTGDGLGPVFNDISCAKCHSQAATGGGSDTLETRFGRLSGGVFDPLIDRGGSLIQSRYRTFRHHQFRWRGCP
jgi:hypothetical protein